MVAGMKLIRINLNMKFMFYMWLEAYINLFDSVHSYGCGQAHLGLQKVILNTTSAIY